jgi:hypothetical protein
MNDTDTKPYVVRWADTTKPHVIIRFADKPWYRGNPPTRTVEIPAGYDERQARLWLTETRRIKNDETIASYNL